MRRIFMALVAIVVLTTGVTACDSAKPASPSNPEVVMTILVQDGQPEAKPTPAALGLMVEYEPCEKEDGWYVTWVATDGHLVVLAETRDNAAKTSQSVPVSGKQPVVLDDTTRLELHVQQPQG